MAVCHAANAETTVGTDIWMVDFCSHENFGLLPWIIRWELNV